MPVTRLPGASTPEARETRKAKRRAAGQRARDKAAERLAEVHRIESMLSRNSDAAWAAYRDRQARRAKINPHLPNPVLGALYRANDNVAPKAKAP